MKSRLFALGERFAKLAAFFFCISLSLPVFAQVGSVHMLPTVSASSSIPAVKGSAVDPNSTRPYHIDIPEEALVDLRHRLDEVRWPDQETVADRSQGVRNIVLVHGAWANGSSWSQVIPLLEARGFHVVAAHMPLTSLQDDDAAVERAIERITQSNPGPVLLVGHSYGGVVIGDVPGNDSRVVGLVYVAAFAPDTGQSALSLLGSLSSPPPISNYLVFDPTMTSAWISDEGIARAFAQDLSPFEQRELAAVQGITAVGDLLATPTVTPAWKSKPSWFVISGHDDVITAGLEEREAQAMGAKTIELPTCHVAMLQEPVRIADFISSAAESFNH